MSSNVHKAPDPDLSSFGSRDRGQGLAAMLTQRRDQPASPAAPEEPATPEVAPEAPEATEKDVPEEVEPVAPAPAPKPQPTPRPAQTPKAEPTQEEPPASATASEADRMVRPTVVNVPMSVMRRFERARRDAPSHTAMVLDALRAHHVDLADLVRGLRPAPPPADDLFPLRATPGEREPEDKLPLRIRPLKGELEIIDRLCEQTAEALGEPEVTRSDLISAALDAHLPKGKK
ncbi:hypothetical protein [Nocardiopsis deserti]|uniref:hypothetical protein n=1 Tax=Nocardiopsis deserti TaxID=2605988 RepID=UPI00123BAB5C|nr:hypothetical protein [Nocardiopsis deserti]